MSKMKIVLCDSDELKEKAFRLRYKFYVEELGVRPPNESKMLSDEADPGSTIFLAYSGDDCVGTVRLIDYEVRPFEMAAYTDPSQFVRTPRSIEVTRMIILQKARRSRAIALLACAVLGWCEQNGIRYIYHARRERGVPQDLLNFFRQRKSVCVTEPFEYGGYGPHRIYEIDIEHMDLARLQRIYNSYIGTPATAAMATR